jgi:hypothetical protein
MNSAFPCEPLLTYKLFTQNMEPSHIFFGDLLWYNNNHVTAKQPNCAG